MAKINDSAYDGRAPAFNVYCKECEALVIGPQKSKKYKHIFDNYQGQRFAKRPEGACVKCGTIYNLLDESSFLRETKDTLLAKKVKKASDDAAQKVLDDDANGKFDAEKKAADELNAKSKKAAKDAEAKIKAENKKLVKKTEPNSKPNSNPGDSLDKIPGL